jgi:hypothetical protein
VVRVREVGRQRLYRVDGSALKPIHDWIAGFERLWGERYAALDTVLEELKQGGGDADQRDGEGDPARG